MGVKVTVKEKVEELSAWADATPYYTLASEFEDNNDYTLAEIYYNKSLDKCVSFWPALFGLGSIYQDLADDSEKPYEYTKSIDYYKMAIELDKQNIYSYNNLAAVYLDAPDPIYSPKKALEYANKALEIMPTFPNSLYYKALAILNIEPIDYKEMKKALNSIDPDDFEDTMYSVMYMLAVANSNLHIHLTKENLDELFNYYEDGEESEDFAEYLRNDMELFSIPDRSKIKEYLDKNYPPAR
jgi:tetratricopeptide (TPR) repeat protein